MSDSGTRWPNDSITRWSRRALRVATLLVPFRGQREWLMEWEAELWQLRNSKENPVRLVAFLTGAFGHGLWEWKEGWRMDILLQDARYALRTLTRSPGFTAAAVLMLAMAIGANTALFSVLEQAVLTEPPFPEAERLVVVDSLFGRSEENMGISKWSYPRYQALVDEVRSIDNIAGYGLRTMTLTELGNPIVIGVETVTPALFGLLGIEAIRGRVFGPDEVDNGDPNMVALVSHGFWQTRMGASPDAVGASMTLDRLRFTVLGVLGPGFDGITGGAELWIPFSAMREVNNDSLLDDAWNQTLNLIGRLAPGFTLESARSEVQIFGATIMERFPPPVAASRLVSGADVVPYRTARVNPVAETSMFALFGAVALVLLVATANLASLLLARGAARGREAAVRASLGAGRARLVRQMLTESLSLAVMGGVLGIGVAWVGLDVLGAWLTEAVGTGSDRGLKYLDPDSLSLDWGVLMFGALLTGGVGVVFGILPALQAARTNPTAALKGGGASLGAGPTAFGLPGQTALVVFQVGVALVLMTGATLMMRSLANLQSVDVGYDSERLLTAVYGLTPAEEQAGVDLATFHLDFLERVRALPGVVGATVGEIPMGGPTYRTIVMGSEGDPELTPQMHTWVRLQPVADGHLGLLGADFLEGRDIEAGDGTDNERVIVLNRRAVDVLFPNGNPIGRKIQLGWADFGGNGVTVVGVVRSLQFEQGFGLAPELQGWVSMRQAPRPSTGLMVRTQGDPQSLVPIIRRTLAEVNSSLALTSVMTMEERAASVTARHRVVSMLLGTFAGISLFLVAAGLYGTIAFTVAGRTRELGLRASLGANRSSLLALVLRQGLGVTVLGILLGLVGAWWTTRFLEGLLFGIDPVDPLTFVGTSGTLFLVALVASYLPARRAMHIDPMTALRED